MSDFFILIGDLENRKNPSDFGLDVPKPLTVELFWECASLEIPISCSITLKRERVIRVGRVLRGTVYKSVTSVSIKKRENSP